MIPVSDRWKELNEQTLLPEMFVELTYSITEPGLQDEASISVTNKESYSNVDQVIRDVDKNSESYSTLDYGAWGLDGNYSYFDGTPNDPGYIHSVYSESDGTLTVQPEITIDFDTRHTVAIPGITITWDKAFGGWATDFIVVANNSNGEVARTVVRGNTSVVSQIQINLVDYSQIKITVLKWSHPYQRMRCISILLGMKTVYTKDDLLGFSHKQVVDLLSATLPENSITFKLRNDDDRWNPELPTGAERYLAERQEVSLRYGMDVDGVIEWIPGGTFWLNEWNTPSNGMEADFTAQSAIGFMGAAYSGVRSGTLYDIAVSALEQASLPKMSDGSNRYIVSEKLREYTTDFSSENTSYLISEVVQMVAHAGNCVFYQDRNGIIHVEPWNQVYSGYVVDPNISYTHPEYTFNKPLKTVSVEYGSEKESVELEYSSTGEIQTVSNPFVRTETDATRVAKRTLEVLQNRKVVSGDFRADLRMDALDNIIVTSKYSKNVVGVTEVEYSTTDGAFRGKYTGRVVSIKLEPVNVYSDEIYSNEIW